ncbi:hypothetical protein PtA15_13A211 [Puccinia triticina]|uniref:Uncharacterized protein n=1 Tax=Puccinia triticina TaxID=208348 RepID=A0ABY7D3G4_9BASI|nr:uncharacterized protein PtA15_13A211 [Puccinia triticina]WAQ90812.1 hypothetical protein PtA15_13A211 [Puccinia triticina]WAR60998.1 hypothetical protein PtB15_13B249 [Puccinia triticina]
MSDSKDGGMSGLINSFATLQSKDQKAEIQSHEVLVTNEMIRIHNEYLSMWERINYGKEPRVLFNEIEIRTQLLAKLKSKSLPSLRRHTNAISKALLLRRSDPPLDTQPTPLVYKLKLVMKSLSKLESTLRDIKFAVACISPALDVREMRDDRDFKDLKFFKSARLALITYAATGRVCEFLRISHKFIKEFEQHFYEDPSRRHEIEKMANTCAEAVNRALIFIDKSEMPQEVDAPDIPYRTVCLWSIIKLSRIAVAKLLKMSTDTKNLTMASDLNSRELELFVGAAKSISERVASILGSIRADIPDNEAGDLEILKRALSDLLGASRAISLLSQYIFRPVHPDQLPSKICLKAWFYQWNKLYRMAIQNFLKDVFDENGNYIDDA